MPNEYKQCPNGHYYQGSKCPYCRTVGSNDETISSSETKIYGSGGGRETNETIPIQGMGGPTKTTVVGEVGRPAANPRPSNHTVFDDELVYDGDAGDNQRGYRETRKLVGWLVSYTLNATGVDFKLYEGRNIIGRDAECNISVNDNMVSGRHAVLLFRGGKYSITDSQSSHGTFVNENDIELEPCYLQDGDMIRIGRTLFKFKSSL